MTTAAGGLVGGPWTTLDQGGSAVGPRLALVNEGPPAERAERLLEAYRHHHEENHDALIRAFPDVARDLSRLQADYPGWEVTVSLDTILEELARAGAPALS